MRKLTILLALVLLLAQPVQAANLTPPNLSTATGAADADLMLIWPTASVGPLENFSWAALKAQIATDLAATWLKPSSNLSDLANATTARTNLGLGTAAVAFTGNAGGTVPLLNAANTWSATQTFSTQPAFTRTAWTPTVTFATPGNLNVVYSAQGGSVIQVGNLCYAAFNLATSTFTFTTASGNFEIAGLPGPIDASYQGDIAGGLGNWSGLTGLTQTPWIITQGASLMELQTGTNSSSLILGVANFTTGNNIALRGSFTYRC